MSQFYTKPPARGSSAAAVGDDVRVDRRTGSISAAAPAPGEGLPPCFAHYAQCDNRVAVIHDSTSCQWPDKWHHKDQVMALATTDFKLVPRSHPCNWIVEPPQSLRMWPASEWPRAERWVRTGVL